MAFGIIFIFYTVIWKGRGSEWLVLVFQKLLNIGREEALNLYQHVFRNNADAIMITAIGVVFFILLAFFLNRFTRYFNAINIGIETLLQEEEEEITLPPEMAVTEHKLNAVKHALKQRAMEIQLSEQRKNELVMYLAHDIRTPLTSVIGYLNLLEEAHDMPEAQKEKYVHITLEKAYRLEKMVNEFFEITRYNMQQISLTTEEIDLYYMLVQLSDELSPLLSANGNFAVLHADENLTVRADPDRLARVFHNVLKNAAAYSYPNTEIMITAKEEDERIIISFQNKGKTISKDKLSAIFNKFCRLDEARTSDKGGTGLGLSIAKEIVTLHGGTIKAESKDETVVFTISLPVAK